ncbi:MAG: hypothetical protein EP344_15220 [Bacteroidetes bacterium]|nr:MAG: hypothetical protein EP344_15220 [Bacteroidota bacterium]
MKTAQEVQLALFERIQKSGATAHDLAAVLHLGLGAVYKRLKGETLLNMHEIVLLTEKYRQPLDSLLQPQKGVVTFEYPAMRKPIVHVEQYLSTLQELLQWANTLPNAQLHYSTEEIPIFHYLHYPELFAFKLYMWNRTTWEIPEWEDQPFRAEMITASRRVAFLRKAIIDGYNQLPSIELWPASILQNTLNAINYCAESGAFARPDDMHLLRRQVRQLVQHQKEMAKLGLKFSPDVPVDPNAGAFTLYHNEIAHTNITVLLEWEGGRMAFVTFDNPNFMHTTDPEFTAHTANWFTKLRKRALPISKEGEKHRDQFFNLLLQYLPSD